MAETTEQIILQVKADNSEAITQMAKLTQETTKLKDENAKLTKQNKESQKAMSDLAKEGKKNSDEYKALEASIAKNNTTLELNKASIKSLSSEHGNLQKQITASISMQKANEGSLIQQAAELAKLNAEYARMSKTEKETTDRGKELKASIEAKSAAYKEEQMAIGNTYVNVGNYQAAMEGAITKQAPFLQGLFNMSKQAKETGQTFGGTLVNSLNSAGQAMLKLLANPLVAALAVIALQLMGIVKIIKSNEEQMDRLMQIFAPFKKLLDGVLNVLQKAVDVVLDFIEFIMKGIGFVMTLLERLPLVGDKMKEINEATREAIALEKAKDELQEQNRRNLITFAELDRNIAELRYKATLQEQYSAEQRLAFLQESNKLSEQKLLLQQASLKEELRILEIEAARNKNSEEVNDKIYQLKAEIIRAEQAYFEEVKGNSKKINAFLSDEAATRKKEQEDRIAKAKEWAKIREEAEIKIRDLTIAIMAEGFDKEKKLLDAKLADDLKQVTGTEKQKAEQKRLINEQYQIDLTALELKYSEERYNKTLAKLKEETEIRISLAKEGSDTALALQLQKLELEREQAIRNAKETGVSVDLINQEFDALRVQAIQTNEEKIREIKKEEYQKTVDAEQTRFELELARLYGNELALAEAEVSIEEQKLTKLLQMDTATKQALGLNEEQYALLVQQQRNKVTQAIENTTAAQRENFAQMREGIFMAADAINSILSAVAENQEEYGVFAKAAALFQIGLKTAESIAAAIAGATAAAAESGPAAPYLIAGYIASMVATVTAAMFQATEVLNGQNNPNAPSFATGGRVTGPGSATSDSIAANLSNGESIMTAAATNMFAPLLSGLNQMGGGVPITVQGVVANFEGEEMLARAFAKGIASMPNPVVSVEEIDRVQSRVKVLENLRK